LPKCYLCGSETVLRFHGVPRCLACDEKQGYVSPWELPRADSVGEAPAEEPNESMREPSPDAQGQTFGGLTPEPA